MRHEPGSAGPPKLMFGSWNGDAPVVPVPISLLAVFARLPPLLKPPLPAFTAILLTVDAGTKSMLLTVLPAPLIGLPDASVLAKQKSWIADERLPMPISPNVVKRVPESGSRPMA